MLLIVGSVCKTSSSTIARLILEIADGHVLARQAAELHPARRVEGEQDFGHGRFGVRAAAGVADVDAGDVVGFALRAEDKDFPRLPVSPSLSFFVLVRCGTLPTFMAASSPLTLSTSSSRTRHHLAISFPVESRMMTVFCLEGSN